MPMLLFTDSNMFGKNADAPIEITNSNFIYPILIRPVDL